MSTFISRTSPVTGKSEWILQNDDYDYHQEVARSAYADMLHDTERNVKYEEALKLAIQSVQQSGREALVLDIGTGTGLLSMMAARHGADSITACEAFSPMADCARQIIRDNGFEDKIRIIPKRSTELKVATDGDLTERCNILVTEVFDTELIGEGAIRTFKHALDELLVKDCIVIPSSAVVYVQVVQSFHFRKWNTFETIEFSTNQQTSSEENHREKTVRIHPPAEVLSCPGSPGVHDLQLDQVSPELFQPITDPQPLVRFDFMKKEQLEFTFPWECRRRMESLRDGRCDAVFMWWVLQMDVKGQIELSAAPRWHHPTPNDMQWRDHWMQAIYYPTSRLRVRKRETFQFVANHDEYSWWFDITEDTIDYCSGGPVLEPCRTPACVCGAHVACSRTRIAMLNDGERNKSYISALKKLISKDTVCLCLGDESLLPFMAAKLGASQVFSIQANPLSARLSLSYCRSNGLDSTVHIIQKHVDDLNADDLLNQQVTLLVAEPFFVSSYLPWHNLYFLYARASLLRFLSPECKVLPGQATLKAIAVSFKDLHKIRADVGICQGFKLDAFDRLIEKSSDIADDYAEPHPLWEYPSIPLSSSVELIEFDFTQSLDNNSKRVENEGSVPLFGSGSCNGIAMWMEYQLLDTVDGPRISSGLIAPPVSGKPLQWDPYTQQAVHFFKKPIDVQCDSQHQLHYKVIFNPNSGEFHFDFRVEASKSLAGS